MLSGSGCFLVKRRLTRTNLVIAGLGMVVGFAQEQKPPEMGAVVVEVSNRSEGQKVGIGASDSISSWAFGAVRGDIHAPFDLTEAELEYGNRGPVVLHGRHGQREVTWTMTQEPWGIRARPVLPEVVLSGYEEGRKLASAHKAADAAAQWRSLADRAGQTAPPWTVVWLLSEAADALAAARQWNDADEVTRLALAQAADAGPMIRAQLLETWAQTFYRGGRRDWQQAALHLQESLELRRQLSAKSLAIAEITSALGFVNRNQGLLGEAQELYSKALAIGEDLAPGSPAVATYLNNLGGVAWWRGELIQAEDYFQQALAIRRKIAPGTTFRVLNNLGAVALQESAFGNAAQYWEEALTMAAPDSGDAALMLHNLGRLAEVREDIAGAEGFERRSSDLLAKLDPNGLEFAASLARLGRTALRRGDVNGAEELHRRALAIREKSDPGGLGVAESDRDLGQIAETRRDFDKAEEYQLRALSLREQLARGTQEHADSLFRMAALRRAMGQMPENEELLGQALQIIESRAAKLDGTEGDRLSFRVQYAPYYGEYLDALLSDKRPEQAFAVSERSLARSLLEMMAERDLMLSADLPSELKQARKLNDGLYDSVQAQLLDLPAGESAQKESLMARLVGLSNERDLIAERIRRASPRVAALQYPQPLDLEGAWQTLDPGTLLLSYSVGPEHSVLFVLPAGGTGARLSVFTIAAGQRELRSRVEEFRKLIEHGGPSGRAVLAEKSRALYDLLVKPAEGQIGAARRLLIVPDGALRILPFAALRRENRLLVEWKPLHTVVSMTVYAELKKMRGRAADAPIEWLAFGDPRFPETANRAPQTVSAELRAASQRGLELERLPFSQDEVKSIAALYPRHSQTYLGLDATEDRAKSLSPAARLIHFAVHAFLDEDNPLDSALVLTVPERRGEGRDNGLLQAWEIIEQVRLNADLVVLSACETGLGKEERGEGLIGLTRAFQYAGARSILASLWRVDDRKTAQLMTEFYTAMRSGKSKDEALQTAQLNLIRRNAADPYYWAAFSLIGDWQ